jgi:hypothetical protein
MLMNSILSLLPPQAEANVVPFPPVPPLVPCITDNSSSSLIHSSSSSSSSSTATTAASTRSYVEATKGESEDGGKEERINVISLSSSSLPPSTTSSDSSAAVSSSPDSSSLIRQDSNQQSSSSSLPSKTNSIETFGDITGYGSNDTTVPVTEEDFEQPQHGTSLNSKNQSQNAFLSLSGLHSHDSSSSFDYSLSQSQSSKSILKRDDSSKRSTASPSPLVAAASPLNSNDVLSSSPVATSSEAPVVSTASSGELALSSLHALLLEEKETNKEDARKFNQKLEKQRVAAENRSQIFSKIKETEEKLAAAENDLAVVKKELKESRNININS